jgi:uncharacterized protein (TIGR02466 family)
MTSMFKEGSTRDIFPVKIYEAKYENFETIQQSLIEKALASFEGNIAPGNDYYDQNGKDVFTRTLPNLHLRPEFKEIVEFIEFHGKLYWKELGLTTQEEPYVLQLWANDVPPGGFTASHNHTPIAIGGSLYLDADPLKGNIHLEDPTHMEKGRMPFDWQKQPYVYTEEIEVSAGKIVMFPGWLMHHVRSNRSSSNRIVLGFNFGLSWSYRPKPY